MQMKISLKNSLGNQLSIKNDPGRIPRMFLFENDWAEYTRH